MAALAAAIVLRRGPGDTSRVGGIVHDLVDLLAGALVAALVWLVAPVLRRACAPKVVLGPIHVLEG